MRPGSQTREALETADSDSVWLCSTIPTISNRTRTFSDDWCCSSAGRRSNCCIIRAYAAANVGVSAARGGVFTGDNVFHKCKTFVQEATRGSGSTRSSRLALDVETIVLLWRAVTRRNSRSRRRCFATGSGDLRSTTGLTEEEALRSRWTCRRTSIPIRSGSGCRRAAAGDRGEYPQGLKRVVAL
jgi:hypothetical protein